MSVLRASRIAHNMLGELLAFRRLAADLPSFARLGVDVFGVRLLRLMELGHRERTVRLRGGIRLTYRLNRGDLRALAEVWGAEAYMLPPGARADVVIDLGANIGLTSVWLARRYGSSRVIAVEPSLSNARLARRNLADNRVAGEVVEAAVGAVEGFAFFDESADSTLGRVAHHGSKVQMLTGARIAALVPEPATIDLVKIDIEGGEEDVLTRETGWLRRVALVMVELHPDRMDAAQVVEAMRQLGFEYTSQSVRMRRGRGDPVAVFRRRAAVAACALGDPPLR